jgi:hypothetical protein
MYGAEGRKGAGRTPKDASKDRKPKRMGCSIGKQYRSNNIDKNVGCMEK